MDLKPKTCQCFNNVEFCGEERGELGRYRTNTEATGSSHGRFVCMKLR